jgi:hypothetical protein
MSEADLILIVTMAFMILMAVVAQFIGVDVDENGVPISKNTKLT